MSNNTLQIRNAYKQYGKASNPNVILKGLNMTVRSGSIYALLGPSGCGKTTLLSCIVGTSRLNSGEIKINGNDPISLGSGSSSKTKAKFRIGWMPQEIALSDRLTVKEVVHYFGRIYELPDDVIHDKFKFLNDLLELPPQNRWVENCSGGQQRRISFACAMVNDPDLLILDEPTVGLDPLLREKIWDFLVNVTKNSKMSVLLTTHYVEEARQANCIGLMRNGVILAENSPQVIMNQFGVNSIEEAFLALSQRQEILTVQGDVEATSQTNKAQLSNSQIEDIETTSKSNIELTVTNPISILKPKAEEESKGNSKFRCPRLKALLIKNIIDYRRNKNQVLFNIFYPIMQLACFYLAIGRSFTDLKIGIHTSEVSDYRDCFDTSLKTVALTNQDICTFDRLSCRFINVLGSDIGEKIFFNTMEEGEAAYNRKTIHTYISFSKNYSTAVEQFLQEGSYSEDNILNSMSIPVRLELANQQIAIFIQRKVLDSFETFMQSVMIDCNRTEKLVNRPIRIEDPIYGSFDREFQEYMGPGIVLIVIYFLTMNMSISVFIDERVGGIWNRTLIAGIPASLMLFSHFIFQTFIAFWITVESFIFVGLCFNPPIEGDIILIFTIAFIGAFLGIVTGFLISVLCTSHFMAGFVATGIFYPLILLSGIIWPIEGMPDILRKIVIFLPFTIPIQSARNVIEKAWGFTNLKVYDSFIVLAVWTIILIILTIMGLRRKS